MVTQTPPIIDAQTKQAVQQTLLAHAREEGIRLPKVDSARVHRIVFAGAAVGGVTLYYVERIKAAMVTELIQDAIVKRVVKEMVDLYDIDLGKIHEDVYGKSPVAAETYKRIERVWYGLRIREYLSRRR